MGFGMKRGTAAIDHAVAHAASFEITVGDLARKSERRAWAVAYASMALTLLLAGGYYYMLPLKEKVPYVVMADPFSGTASVAALRADATYNAVTAAEALARANVANYVTARESYDAELLTLRDWNQVFANSSGEVGAAYRELMADTNPNSPAKLVRGRQAIRVRILSITPMGTTGNVRGATVRFQRSLFDRATGKSQPMDSRIATLMFEYKPNLQLRENLRWLNPLGFQVTQYRVDTDFSAVPNIDVDEALKDAMQAIGAAEAAPATPIDERAGAAVVVPAAATPPGAPSP